MGSGYSAVADPAAFVASTIASNRIIMFSKTYCPYCVKAKAALASLRADYATVELDRWVWDRAEHVIDCC